MADEDDIISQDDLEALVKDFGDTAGAPPSGNPSGDTQDLQPAVSLVLNQASTVVSTVISKTVHFGPEPVSAVTEEFIKNTEEKFSKGGLAIQVKFTDGLKGNLFFIMQKKDAAVLADFMMMGDGTANYEEDHRDAIAELVNQIMGAVGTAMGSELGFTIASEQAGIQDYNPSEPPFEPEKSFGSRVSLEIEGKDASEALLVLDPEMTASLSGKFKKEESPKEDADGTGDETGDTSGGTMDLTRGSSTPIYASTGKPNIDMLLDVPLDVTIELGRADLSIRKILELGPGSIIELDRRASEPVDLLVNDRVVAKGEVVVVDEYFGVRIVSLISPEERIKHLR